MLGQFYVKGVREETCERVNQKLKTDVKAGLMRIHTSPCL